MSEQLNDNCLVCGGPLSDFETLRRRPWHDDCNKCPICGQGPLEDDMLTRQLARGLPIGHSGCVASAAMRDLKDKTIPMRLEQIHLLNREMCTIWIAEPNTKDIDLLYEILKSGKELCANVSMVLDRTKEKLQQSETQKYREKTKEQKQAERDATRKAAEVEIDKAKRQETLAAEREDPALKLRRKAVESYMKLGFSKDAAEAQIKLLEDRKQ